MGGASLRGGGFDGNEIHRHKIQSETRGASGSEVDQRIDIESAMAERQRGANLLRFVLES